MKICHVTPHLPPDQAANALLPADLGRWAATRGDDVRWLSQEPAQGRLAADEISEDTVAGHLYTAGMSDPDLLIRTAGEMRVSNFLLWQISYAELWITDDCWPDFREEHLHAALRDFASRDLAERLLEPWRARR